MRCSRTTFATASRELVLNGYRESLTVRHKRLRRQIARDTRQEEFGAPPPVRREDDAVSARAPARPRSVAIGQPQRRAAGRRQNEDVVAVLTGISIGDPAAVG